MALNTSGTDAGAHILVVDDEPDLRTLYELTLLREGYQVDVAENLNEGWQRLNERRYDVLITDMRLPDGLGIELIQRLHAQQRSERCVVITAYGSAENAVESLKAGAFDYLTKPVNLREFRTVIASAAQNGTANKSNVVTRRPARNGEASSTAMPEAGVALDRLVGNSPGMRLVKDRIAKAARGMAPVLISGESGTGKELAASALHANSHRGDGPLVAVNCSAIPENLLETEFFGVRKGAYTGATQDRDGFFQAARGGSLFLDEIGDLPLAMQSKLLRAIQERCVRPVGGTQEESVDVRIISATHKDLAAEVQAGRFRQDLYYRLNVIQVIMPPLRERREDLPALCEALLKKIARESGVPIPEVTPEVLAQLGQLSLNGNVRELENLLHRAAALNDGGELNIEPDSQSGELTPLPSAPSVIAPDIAPAMTTNSGATEIPNDLQQHLDQQERDILIKVLHETGFNRTAAAARLGLSLRQIRYRIARLNIDAPPGSDSTP